MPARPLFRLVQLMNQQDDEREVLAALTGGEAARFGITSVVMARYTGTPESTTPDVWASGVSDGYVTRYRERRYDLKSPAMAALKATRTPIVWRLRDFDFSVDSETAEIAAGAVAEGLEKGALVPVWRDGVLTGWVALALDEAGMARIDLFALQLLGLTAFYRIEELTTQAGADAPPISPREREVLDLAAKGLSSKEIARDLTISSRTVEFHFQNVAEKLETHNKTHSVAKAMRLGLIRPS